MPRILDLYSGIGGFSLGFALGLEGAKILGLDIDKAAVATYNFNLNKLGAQAINQDVLKWEPKGDYDLVIGGSPCQPFSLANNPRYKKIGEAHPLYPTFPRFFDVVLKLKPEAFLLENVPGLVTPSRIHYLERQLKRTEHAYFVAWKILNMAHYGVPQSRERVFVLGIRKDLKVKPTFPEPSHAETEKITLLGRIFRWVTVQEAIGDLLTLPPQGPIYVFNHVKPPGDDRGRLVGCQIKIGFPRNFHKLAKNSENSNAQPPEHRIMFRAAPFDIRYRRIYKPVKLDEPSKTLIANAATSPFMALVAVPAEYINLWFSQNIDSLSGVDLVMNMIGQCFNGQKISVVYRRLTVQEILRIQSFPGWWKFPPNVSERKRYELLGEVVPPIMSYRLALHIGGLLGWKTRKPPKPEEWDLPYFNRAFQDFVTSQKA